MSSENILKFIEAIDYYHKKQIDPDFDYYGSIVYDYETNKELHREYKEYKLFDRLILNDKDYAVIRIEKDISKTYTKVQVELFEYYLNKITIKVDK